MKTALVLGGRGRFGRHAAEAFAQAGWTVPPCERERADLDEAVAGAD